MTVPYSDINLLLSKWASNETPVLNFTVNNVLTDIGLDHTSYNPILRYLLSKDGFELVAKKMLLCPNNHKGRTFLLAEPINNEHLFVCWCGEQYYFDPENAIVVFCFTDNFIRQERLKKNSICNCNNT